MLRVAGIVFTIAVLCVVVVVVMIVIHVSIKTVFLPHPFLPLELLQHFQFFLLALRVRLIDGSQELRLSRDGVAERNAVDFILREMQRRRVRSSSRQTLRARARPPRGR